MTAQPGVYSASVLDNHDPKGLARVRVRVSGLIDTPGTLDLWARVATLMAGPDRGTWFMPEIGDEVLVAFERGDVKVPYMIGALWSAKARPPVQAGDPAAGDTLIRWRGGVTLRIGNDTAGISLTLETPGGQRLIMRDAPGSVHVEDGNGNFVTLSPSGVAVNASASVTVAASSIEINAGMVTVNAGMSRFSGVVQCDTLIANSVISASYTPGAGNQW
jgi:uncharacterized protein involved in type VI secretion and phage assembly